jgi:hydroxymethylpyrimidine pyrophosphatase-like HAD family hydrolase
MVEIVAFIDERRSLYPELGYQRNSIYLRFTHRDFDKGSALRELTRQLGVGPQFVFAAGDNHNDLSMLRSELAHGLCCPSNAIWEVKDQVRREGGLIANSPGSSGMVEAMQHYFYNSRADGR